MTRILTLDPHSSISVLPPGDVDEYRIILIHHSHGSTSATLSREQADALADALRATS